VVLLAYLNYIHHMNGVKRLSAAVLSGALTAFLSVGVVPSATATDRPLQAVLNGGKCGDPIEISAVSRTGEVLDRRTVVRAKPGVKLEVQAASREGNQFLFTTYDCTTETYALYRQYIGLRPKADLLRALPSDWRIVAATWDSERDAPAVLYRDPDFNYQLDVLYPSGWAPIWFEPTTEYGIYPRDIQDRGGGEFVMVGFDTIGTWSAWRLYTSERSGPYTSKFLEGEGRIRSLAATKQLGAIGYIGERGKWICDGWSAEGTIEEAVARGDCAEAGSGGAQVGVIGIGESDSWLNVAVGMTGGRLYPFECSRGFLSCPSPTVEEGDYTSLGGESFAYIFWGEGKDGYIKTKFSKLGASRI